MVTSRLPNTEVYDALLSDDAANAAAGIRSVTRIGDCLNPGIIAAAVHDGHRYARALGAAPSDLPFRVEYIEHARGNE
jgi:dimethylamine/trimethylamine dehydrogenase